VFQSGIFSVILILHGLPFSVGDKSRSPDYYAPAKQHSCEIGKTGVSRLWEIGDVVKLIEEMETFAQIVREG
jgi:hypothetical protein